jgi:hypothetical protein
VPSGGVGRAGNAEDHAFLRFQNNAPEPRVEDVRRSDGELGEEPRELALD